MGRLSLSAAILGFALLAVPALASAQPAPLPPGWTWTGGYIGVNLGMVQNIDNGQDNCFFNNVEWGSPGCIAPVLGKIHSQGFLGGVTLGYNWQAGPLVVGVEGDYDGSSLTGNVRYSGFVPYIGHGGAYGNFTASEGLSWLSSERLRLGLAMGRGSMVYVTGGPAQSVWQLASNLYGGGYAYTTPTTQVTRNGWMEGIGYESALEPRMTIRVEVLSDEFQPYQTNAHFGGSPYSAGKDFLFHGAAARVGLDWRI